MVSYNAIIIFFKVMINFTFSYNAINRTADK